MHAGRSSDGKNVPVSVDCAPYHYVSPTTDWNSTSSDDDQRTSSVDDVNGVLPTAVIDAQQTDGYVKATGSQPLPQPSGSQGQGQDDLGTQPVNPDTPSTQNDDTGDNI